MRSADSAAEELVQKTAKGHSLAALSRGQLWQQWLQHKVTKGVTPIESGIKSGGVDDVQSPDVVGLEEEEELPTDLMELEGMILPDLDMAELLDGVG